MDYQSLQNSINAAWDNKVLLQEEHYAEAVCQTIEALDKGFLRVASPANGNWQLNE